MLRNILALASFFVAVKAACDNACSGHGTCGQKGVCTCYDNWGIGLSHDSGDCSEKVCPFEFSWVDKPDKIGARHKYSECASRGICNRETGECDCFPGYEGKACQRTTCPNDCSGHGQCVYIESLPYAAVANDYPLLFSQDPKTFTYRYWDETKTRGCLCDPEYGDVDCSKRMCEHGNDVMDQRDNLNVGPVYQVQHLSFLADSGQGNVDLLAGQTFALTFKSQLNETFTTAPIQFYTDTSDFHEFILDVQEALERLPNRVIDQVTVHGDINGVGNGATLNISFVGEHVQGTQNLLTIRDFECLDGCTPKITGLLLYPDTFNNVTEHEMPDYNSYECGRRGKCDYSTGLCTCFAGYTGLSCNTITSLV